MLQGHIAVDPTSGGVTPSGTLTSNAIIVGAGTSVVQATDRFLECGTGQTINAVTDDLITLTMPGSNAVYRIVADVAGLEATPLGAGLTVRAVVMTDGSSASLIGTSDSSGETGSWSTVDAEIVVSGNTAILRVTGEAGATIDWNGCLEYTVAS